MLTVDFQKEKAMVQQTETKANSGINGGQDTAQTAANTTTDNEQKSDDSRSLGQWLLLLWDVSIIVLVAANLGLIIIDSFFAIEPLNKIGAALLPQLHQFFDNHIHQNFQSIDLLFVMVFIADVVLSWIVAIFEKRHERWWFYPFVHWYDVLGCIPLAGFRFLRVLRVISILIRLQRLGLIDVRNWPAYKFLMRYYGIIIEEVSDLVVENVLTGVQEEIRSGASELPAKIINRVIVPRQEGLVDEITSRISETTGSVYAKNRDQVHKYVAGLIKGAVHSNAAAKRIDKIPGLGDVIIGAIDHTLAETSCELIDEVVESLSSKEFERVLNSMLDSILASVLSAADKPMADSSKLLLAGKSVEAGDSKTKKILQSDWTIEGSDDAESESEQGQIMIEVLEIVKEQVRKKRWKNKF